MQFECPVVQITKLDPVPKSDALDITTVFETPVIVRKGQLKVGDLAVYIPVESMVPMTKPQFQGLGIKTERELYRVKAVRLRGTYSEGLLVPLSGSDGSSVWGDAEFMSVGYDMAPVWGITKYEEPELPVSVNGKVTQQARDLPWAPKYNVESILKNRDSIPEGEGVEVTEKIHGCNGRFVWDGNELHVGSHNVWKKPMYLAKNPASRLSRWWLAFQLFVNKFFVDAFKLELNNDDVWWQTAKALNLKDKLQAFPMYVFYGEVYGKVQDLKYGVEGTAFRVFDIYNANTKEWESPYTVKNICATLNIEHVPVLYEGPYFKDVVDPLRSGKSTLHDGTIREGIVIKLLNNRGRNSAMKYVSEAYKLRKGETTEFH